MIGFLFDAVAWLQAAALILAIALAGLLLIASLIVGYMPFVEDIPAIKGYVITARFVVVLAFGALTALLTLQLAGDRCDALRAADREAAERARIERDDTINRDLQKAYGPVLQDLANRNAELQGRLNHVVPIKPPAAARPKPPPAVAACRLGDAAGGVRAQPR